jgi:hypothetical protein
VTENSTPVGSGSVPRTCPRPERRLRHVFASSLALKEEATLQKLTGDQEGEEVALLAQLRSPLKTGSKPIPWKLSSYWVRSPNYPPPSMAVPQTIGRKVRIVDHRESLYRHALVRRCPGHRASRALAWCSPAFQRVHAKGPNGMRGARGRARRRPAASPACWRDRSLAVHGSYSFGVSVGSIAQIAPFSVSASRIPVAARPWQGGSTRRRGVCQGLQHDEVVDGPLKSYCRDADPGLQ